MTKFLFAAAFIIGAIAISWIGRIFLGTDLLGLVVTVLIAAVYAIGTLELIGFRRATASLTQALNSLTEPLTELGPWISKLHPSLQNPVRLRTEGERNGLPAPIVTPYLVGLLVMLGLLGTFVGMVDTLKGAVVALEGSSELEAIRAGLAAPIEGLGLAFGTSVAGVAASAMLGLLSTISRRERLQVSQLLDQKISSELSQFSVKHQQKLAFKAIQNQAEALPTVAEKLTDLAANLEKMSDRVGQQLLDNQQRFQEQVVELYGELNTSVDQSLKTTLVDSAELINASIQPLAEKTLSELNAAATSTQKQLAKASNAQLSALGEAAQSLSSNTQQALEASLAKQGEANADLAASLSESLSSSSQGLAEKTDTLLAGFNKIGDQWVAQQNAQAEQFSATIKQELQSLQHSEAQRGDAAVARLGELETVVSEQLASLGQALEKPMARLIETASETPKAAAEVIEKLRGEMTKNTERDNELLGERARLLEQLDGLAKTLETSTSGQRDAIDALVASSTEVLGQVSSQFGQHIEDESNKLASVADHVAASGAEMGSLSEAFNTAVVLFSDSNNQLIENLTRIEASLDKSTSRSDEQLAYYVAQAREIIDHNLLSHQQIIAALNNKKPEQLTVGVSGAGA